jgi:hypothetical protein
MMKTNKRVRSAVAAGITYLFATRGEEWPRRVNVDRLDLASECGCVLGQLEGSYYEAVSRLGIIDGNKLGFEIEDVPERLLDDQPEIDRRWKALTSAWRTAIRRLQRRAA